MKTIRYMADTCFCFFSLIILFGVFAILTHYFAKPNLPPQEQFRFIMFCIVFGPLFSSLFTIWLRNAFHRRFF